MSQPEHRAVQPQSHLEAIYLGHTPTGLHIYMWNAPSCIFPVPLCPAHHTIIIFPSYIRSQGSPQVTCCVLPCPPSLKVGSGSHSVEGEPGDSGSSTRKRVMGEQCLEQEPGAFNSSFGQSALQCGTYKEGARHRQIVWGGDGEIKRKYRYPEELMKNHRSFPNGQCF